MAVPKQSLSAGSEVVFDHTPQPIHMITRRRIGVGYTAAEALSVIGEYVDARMTKTVEDAGETTFEVVIDNLKFTVTAEVV